MFLCRLCLQQTQWFSGFPVFQVLVCQSFVRNVRALELEKLFCKVLRFESRVPRRCVHRELLDLVSDGVSWKVSWTLRGVSSVRDQIDKVTWQIQVQIGDPMLHVGEEIVELPRMIPRKHSQQRTVEEIVPDPGTCC